jgi:hypothetical protein
VPEVPQSIGWTHSFAYASSSVDENCHLIQLYGTMDEDYLRSKPALAGPLHFLIHRGISLPQIVDFILLHELGHIAQGHTLRNAQHPLEVLYREIVANLFAFSYRER